MTGRPPRPALRWLTVHAAVVAVLLGLVALPGVGPTPAGVPLLGLGLPWTLLLLVDAGRLYGLPAAVWWLVTLGPAVVNVLLHAAAVRWWSRRRPAGRRAVRPAGRRTAGCGTPPSPGASPPSASPAPR